MRDFEVGSVSVPSIWLIVAAFLIIFFCVELVSKRAKQNSVGWQTIPQPRSLPILGNLLQLDMKEPLTSLNEIGKQYPDVFRMDLPGTSLVIINSHRLYDEVCDNKRFHKEPVGGILEARHGGGDGLFTAYTDEEAWGIAHRILTPSFGQQGVKEIFDGMLIALHTMVFN
jgi:cytochrome P450/NADPH-cytochrome P450 reductase